MAIKPHRWFVAPGAPAPAGAYRGKHGFKVIGAASTCIASASSYVFSSIVHRFLAFKVTSMAAAAACSPARREPPVPRLRSGFQGTAHLLAPKVWRCVRLATTR